MFFAAPLRAQIFTDIKFRVLDNNRMFEAGEANRYQEDLHWYMRCSDSANKDPDKIRKCRDYLAAAKKDGETVPELRRGDEPYATRYDKAKSVYAPGYVHDLARTLRIEPHGRAAQLAAEPGAECRWTLRPSSKHAPLRRAEGCRQAEFTVALEPEAGRGIYGFRAGVTLEIAARGQPPQRFGSDVYTRDYLIVALGDSFTAGEGNPERNIVEGRMPGQWLDYRCHRSVFSYPVILAQQLATADPRHSVTLLHFACSGARSTIGLRQPYRGLLSLAEARALWFGKNGRRLPDLPSGWETHGSAGGAEQLPSQLEQARRHLMSEGGNQRRPDLVVMSAGVNDMGLTAFLKQIATSQYYWFTSIEEEYARNVGVGRICHLDEQEPPPGTPDDEQEHATAIDEQRRLKLSFACLGSRIDRLQKELATILVPRRVFLMEYHDPLRDERKNICGSTPSHRRLLDDFLARKKFSGLGYALGYGELSKEELAFAHAKFYTPLVETLEKSASRPGWEYVESRGEERTRGFCARPSWYHNYKASRARQGLTPGDDVVSTGTLHPNTFGQYYSAMRALVQIANEKTFPDHNISCLTGPALAHSGKGPNLDGTRGFAWYIWNQDQPTEKLEDRYHRFLRLAPNCGALLP